MKLWRLSVRPGTQPGCRPARRFGGNSKHNLRERMLKFWLSKCGWFLATPLKSSIRAKIQTQDALECRVSRFLSDLRALDFGAERNTINRLLVRWAGR